MKIVYVLTVFTALIVGISGFEWNDIGALVKDEMALDFSALSRPVVQVKDDVEELAVLTKAKIGQIGFADVGHILASYGSADACTNLTNDANVAYQVATNATLFAVSAVEEVTSALNKIVDCTAERLVNQLQCVMDNVKIVRQDILDLQKQFQPFRDETAQIYQAMLTDYKNCLKEW